jgi:predicted ATPase/DNA-binding SARP family transcriptional activator
VEFRVLGALEVVGEDGRLLQLGGVRQRALLAALLLERGRPVSSGQLVEAVWERPPPSAAHAVEVYVSKVRGLLADAEGERERIVRRSGGYLALLDEGELDLERFRTLAERGRAAAAAGDPAAAAEALAAALALWRGTPLACLDGAPVAERAQRELEDERLAAVEARVDAELALGRHAELVAELRRLVAAAPHREPLWAKLMLALYRNDRQTEALETYALARTRLLEQVGIEPGRGLRDLQRRILEQDPALDPPVRPAAARARRRFRLPSPPSSFIGRADELRDAGALLADPDTRLLTILGPGGIGKTRFAIELALGNAARYAEVAWVGIEALDDPRLVPGAIARALELDVRGADPLAALAEELADRRLLLLLDNLEHLLGTAADLHRLLAAAPGLHLIATSREPLRLSAEQRYALPALTPEDARTLFGARAAAVGASDLPAAAVDALCDRLDRLPLAIELAASHTDTQTPQGLLDALDRSLDLDGRRDPPDRQHTIRATIDWSYRLLPQHERRALRRLSVFRGTWTPEATRAVTDTTPDTLTALTEKGLLVQRDERYALLDTVRRYADEQLHRRGERAAIEARHSAWCLALARELEPPHYGGATTEQLRTIAAELPNFRVALERAIDRRDQDTALALIRSLAPHWYELDDLTTSLELARATLALLGGDPADRGHVLYFAGCITMELGRAQETYAHLEEAETSFLAVDDVGGLSLVENLRCFQSIMLGDAARACAEGRRAFELARAAGSRALEIPARQHFALALCLAAISEPTPDRAKLEEALVHLESARETLTAEGRSSVLIDGNSAVVLSELGRQDEALECARRAFRLELERGTRRVAAMLFMFAVIASRSGLHHDAVRLLGAAERRLRDEGTARYAWVDGWATEIAMRARGALSESVYEAARREGDELLLDEAVERALSLTSTRSTETRASKPAQRP